MFSIQNIIQFFFCYVTYYIFPSNTILFKFCTIHCLVTSINESHQFTQHEINSNTLDTVSTNYIDIASNYQNTKPMTRTMPENKVKYYSSSHLEQNLQKQYDPAFSLFFVQSAHPKFPACDLWSMYKYAHHPERNVIP